MIKEDEKDGNTHVGSMQLLNALKVKSMPKASQSKGLMYVEALMNGKPTKTLVDTSATHNLVLEDKAKRLELQASKKEGWLKAITLPPSHYKAKHMGWHT